MRKFLLVIVLFIGVMATAQQKVVLHNSGNVLYASPLTGVDSIKLDASYAKLKLAGNATTLDIQKTYIDSLTFTGNTVVNDKIYIIYNGTEKATIINPYAAQGVTLTAVGATVTGTASSGIEGLEYNILGTSTNGSLTLATDKMVNLVLNNITLTNTSGAAINITGGKITNILLKPGTINTLSDGSGSAKNGALQTDGPIVVKESGSLKIIGVKKHGISTTSTLQVQNGAITVQSAASDAFHSEGYSQSGGSVTLTSVGDGIDAGDGAIAISAGNITITSASADVKAIKTGTGTITIGGGTIALTVSGAQSKAISAKGNITFGGGTTTITLSGAAVLTASGSGVDPSYATGIKTDAQIIVNNGTINILALATANGGKGLSAAGDITINGGSITVTTAGNGATFTNTSGTADSYTAACIKSDANINLLGGTISASSAGTGGKGIKADGAIVIGNVGAANSALSLTVGTSGARFLESGSGNNANYANPKAISCEGNLTVNSGTIRINCTQSTDGGEGLESKNILTINGGNTEIDTYDDAINASSQIVINGGATYCRSRNNDGIDSNGTMTITGGKTISNGARTPEEGFDCDNNTFKITGGVIVGTGGATSNPTTTVSTQRSIKVMTTAGTHVRIRNAANQDVLMYKVPAYATTGGQSNVTLLFTSPDFIAGTYTVQRGGTITGGTDEHGYNTGGTYTGGTSTNVTVNSYLTTVN